MADTHQTINCPACGKPMKKVFIPDAGVNIDICIDGCGGIYFDNREFKLLDEQHEKLDELIAAAENNTFSIQVDENAERYCPVCGAKMVKNPTSVKGGVIVDDCYTCGGKFLDHNELTKVRDEYPTEKERSEAAVRALLYSPEFIETQIADKKATERVNHKMYILNHSIFGKLVNLLMR